MSLRLEGRVSFAPANNKFHIVTLVSIDYKEKEAYYCLVHLKRELSMTEYTCVSNFGDLWKMQKTIVVVENKTDNIEEDLQLMRTRNKDCKMLQEVE